MSYSRSQNFGFSASGTGDDHYWPIPVKYSFALRFIQSL
jgi:hypothetical protein